jgi:hypothetical protein
VENAARTAAKSTALATMKKDFYWDQSGATEQQRLSNQL